MDVRILIYKNLLGFLAQLTGGRTAARPSGQSVVTPDDAVVSLLYILSFVVCIGVAHDQTISSGFTDVFSTPALLRLSRGVKRHQHFFIARPSTFCINSNPQTYLREGRIGGWDFTGAVLEIEKK